MNRKFHAENVLTFTSALILKKLKQLKDKILDYFKTRFVCIYYPPISRRSFINGGNAAALRAGLIAGLEEDSGGCVS